MNFFSADGEFEIVDHLLDMLWGEHSGNQQLFDRY